VASFFLRCQSVRKETARLHEGNFPLFWREVAGFPEDFPPRETFFPQAVSDELGGKVDSPVVSLWRSPPEAHADHHNLSHRCSCAGVPLRQTMNIHTLSFPTRPAESGNPFRIPRYSRTILALPSGKPHKWVLSWFSTRVPLCCRLAWGETAQEERFFPSANGIEAA